MLSAPFLMPAETTKIWAIIRIGQEIWCLPYAGFFIPPLPRDLLYYTNVSKILTIAQRCLELLFSS